MIHDTKLHGETFSAACRPYGERQSNESFISDQFGQSEKPKLQPRRIGLLRGRLVFERQSGFFFASWHRLGIRIVRG
jgi:hypothetical protein